MRTADRLTATFAAAAVKLADAFHPDDYIIERMVRTPDGYGGYTEDPTVVESGKCALAPANRLGAEGPSGPLMVSVTGYEVEMPKTTVLAPTDTLGVNGRRFEVTSVREGGDHDLFTVATVEERR